MRRLQIALGVVVAASAAMFVPMLAESGVQKETNFEPSKWHGTTVTLDGYLVLPKQEGGEFRLARFNSDDTYILQLSADQIQFATECDKEPVKVTGVYSDGGIVEPTKLRHWYLDDVAWQMVCECNRYRQAHALPPLQPSRGLLRTAFQHSWNMRNRYGFRHGGTSGWSGENIAMGQPDPVSVTRDWYNSSGHRANMLNRGYRYIGVAYHNGMWTQQFR